MKVIINQAEFNKKRTIHNLFYEQVQKTPNYTAVKFRNIEITYQSMYNRVNILAAMLRNNGITKNCVVGVITNRSIDMLVSILAILSAGGAYLPIDPDYPEERIRYMLGDSNVNTIISHKSLASKIKFNIDVIFLDNIDFYYNCDLGTNNYSDTNDLAYIIYTSGSTGKPKGVMIEHMSVINFFEGICQIIDFSERKKVLALTTISFDIFVLETLLPLTQGLTVILVDEMEQKNPRLLTDIIINNKIDMLQMTPSRMQLLLNFDNNIECLRNLKEIMVGGEAFPQDLLEKLKTNTNAKIYNMYGPTETTVWSTVSDLTEKNCIDIGKPILNTQIYIIDESNNVVSEGVEGELCIGGSGLARGYINNPELTAEKFIPNPFVLGQRIYKTGDLAKWLLNGNIEYVGRIDNQVKIRGHRIELGEIETVLLKYESIKQAVVNAWKGKDNLKYLCAYYTSDKEILSTYLREYLITLLPDYMVPSYFIRIDSIPQTLNGKLNRKALPEPEFMLGFESKHDFNQNSGDLDNSNVGQIIIKIIRSYIDIPISMDCINLNSNLADLGINSITFIKLVVTIETEFDVEFGYDDLDINKFLIIGSIVTYVINMINN